PRCQPLNLSAPGPQRGCTISASSKLKLGLKRCAVYDSSYASPCLIFQRVLYRGSSGGFLLKWILPLGGCCPVETPVSLPDLYCKTCALAFEFVINSLEGKIGLRIRDCGFAGPQSSIFGIAGQKPGRKG